MGYAGGKPVYITVENTGDYEQMARDLYAKIRSLANQERTDPSERELDAGETPLPFEGKARVWTPEERARLASGELRGAFAGVGRTYPIASAQDVAGAWRQAEYEGASHAVKSNIIAIANDFGWEAGLPTAAKAWAARQ